MRQLLSCVRKLDYSNAYVFSVDETTRGLKLLFEPNYAFDHREIPVKLQVQIQPH